MPLNQCREFSSLEDIVVQRYKTGIKPSSQFDNVFDRWFKLYCSAHPEKPTSTAGVAFVLNKRF
jgi:hypothetical protein